MKRYITIDGGTTNTRIYLVENGAIRAIKKIARGSGSNEAKSKLMPEIKSSIKELLTQNGLSEADIICIIASGMITSEFGLYTVPHSIAPVDVKGIRKNSKETSIPEITSIPFFFISGVKTVGTSPLDTNMMRGEETELVGIMDKGECIYILPGSHNKIISVDKNGYITGFLSTLSGEMIAALTERTILSVSLDIHKDAPSPKGVIDGYEYARARGINEALLKPRALKASGMADNAYIYGFFMGAVLSDEVRPILDMKEKRVVIGGRREIKLPLAELLSTYSDKEIIILDDKEVESSSVKGAIRIYENFL